MIKYHTMDHDADIRIQVFGTDISDLFQNAAIALFDLVTENTETDKPLESETHQISVSGADRPDLMVNWLREILYLWTGKELIVKEIKIRSVSEFTLDAVAECVHFDPEVHSIGTEIKAVTYHMVEVVEETSGWSAKIIFDT